VMLLVNFRDRILEESTYLGLSIQHPHFIVNLISVRIDSNRPYLPTPFLTSSPKASVHELKGLP
jgi:hypothetical protein